MKRTKHPKHNPANLTASQVGRGYRLLDEDEIDETTEFLAMRAAIEAYTDGKCDNSGWAGSWRKLTYRTKLSRRQLAALRKGAKP